jgi:hypothetical protein
MEVEDIGAQRHAVRTASRVAEAALAAVDGTSI